MQFDTLAVVLKEFLKRDIHCASHNEVNVAYQTPLWVRGKYL